MGAAPHLQTQCSHDVLQLVSWALKHAWYGLKEAGRVGGRSPPPPPCKHPAHMMGVNKFLGLCSTLCTAQKKTRGGVGGWGGGGGGAAPHIICTHDVFQLVSSALKHASFLPSLLPSFLPSFLPSLLSSFLPSFLPCFLLFFLSFFLPSFLPFFFPSFHLKSTRNNAFL